MGFMGFLSFNSITGIRFILTAYPKTDQISRACKRVSVQPPFWGSNSLADERQNWPKSLKNKESYNKKTPKLA
jgi:hypothetical protein